MRRILVIGLAATTISAQPSHAQTKLFASGFETDVTISAPYDCGTNCWQDITGTDRVTGFTWPPRINGSRGRLQVLVGTSVTPETSSTYILNEIRTVRGPFGKPTRALYLGHMRNSGNGNQQDLYLIRASGPTADNDLYISYWLQFQPDLVANMGPRSWRAYFAWKTAGDYRIESYVYTDESGNPYWFVHGDNNANGDLPYEEFWSQSNKASSVPAGKWFKVEIFWHRSSGQDGLYWQAIDGIVVFNRRGPNMGVNNKPIDRIMVSLNYPANAPSWQLVDDLEIWNGFPCGFGTPCGTREPPTDTKAR